MSDADLRHGRWQDALDGVTCDAWISDPPFGERTHKGHDAGAKQRDQLLCSTSKDLGYPWLTPDDVHEIVASWSPKTRGWMCAITSHDLIPAWEDAFSTAGRYWFAPLPILEFYRPRLLGDGPGARATFMVVARPREKSFLAQRWGSLPGDYRGPLPSNLLPSDYYERANGDHRPGRMGGKSLTVMRAIVRDYSRPGDIVCDPFAGYGTTLMAALMEGRKAIGSEMDDDAFAAASERLARGYQTGLPDAFAAASERLGCGHQLDLIADPGLE